jgi:diguanylate cyclase (GGDEF)-like protein/PAS domain S-box-containing protein
MSPRSARSSTRRHHASRVRRGTGLAAVAVLMVVAAAGLLISRSQADQRQVLRARYDARHATASRFIEAYIAEVFDREQTVAGRTLSGRVTSEMLAQIGLDQGFDAAVVLDANGRILVSLPASPQSVGMDLGASYPHLRRAMAGIPTVSGVIRPGASIPAVVSFAVPFDTPSGRRVFSTGFAVAATPLGPFIRNATPFHTARVYIVDGAGVVVAASLDGAGRKLADVDASLAATTSGAAMVRTSEGGTYVTQNVIAGTSWRLIFTVGNDELFAPLRSRASVLPWITLGAFALGALLTLAMLYRYLLQRARLVQSEAWRRAIIDSAGEGFVGMDGDGVVTEWNAAATRLLGWSAADALGRPIFDVVVPAEERDGLRAELAGFLSGTLSASPGLTRITAVHRNGSLVDVEFSLSRMQWAGEWHFHAFLHDIGERLEYEATLRTIALTDSLTGLANRRAAVARMEQALARAHRHNTPMAALFIDVDHFKAINDQYGHAAGDGVLIDIGKRLRATFRVEDTLARIGGDEFLVVCEDLSGLPDAAALVERTRRVLAQPYLINGNPVAVTASVGLSRSDANTTVERLLDLADAQMYDAKAVREVFDSIVLALPPQ